LAHDCKSRSRSTCREDEDDKHGVRGIKEMTDASLKIYLGKDGSDKYLVMIGSTASQPIRDQQLKIVTLKKDWHADTVKKKGN